MHTDESSEEDYVGYKNGGKVDSQKKPGAVKKEAAPKSQYFTLESVGNKQSKVTLKNVMMKGLYEGKDHPKEEGPRNFEFVFGMCLFVCLLWLSMLCNMRQMALFSCR